MRKIIAISALLLSCSASAEIVQNSDGTFTNYLPGEALNQDGSSTTQAGNMNLHSDGSTSTVVNGLYINSAPMNNSYPSLGSNSPDDE